MNRALLDTKLSMPLSFISDSVPKVDKSDVEKGVDSDNAANKLCDLVEDIVERVPYLRVLVSMLTPRFDLQVS